jgi:hypothetical protein
MRPATLRTAWMRWQSDAVAMQQVSGIEDHRGVDVSQIRRQLRMSVEDHVQYMVDVTNKLMEVRATVRFLDQRRVQ